MFECETCKGSGQVGPGWPLIGSCNCHDCNGTGKAKTLAQEIAAVILRTCSECKGLGHYFTEANATHPVTKVSCPRCNLRRDADASR